MLKRAWKQTKTKMNTDGDALSLLGPYSWCCVVYVTMIIKMKEYQIDDNPFIKMWASFFAIMYAVAFWVMGVMTVGTLVVFVITFVIKLNEEFKNRRKTD